MTVNNGHLVASEAIRDLHMVCTPSALGVRAGAVHWRRAEEVRTMTRVRKALLVALPAAALVIGGVGIAAAAGGQPTAPVTEQQQVTSTVQEQQQAPGYGDQVRQRNQVQVRDQDKPRDGTCDPVGDQIPDRDQNRDHDRVHDPIQDRLHDGTGR